MLTLVTSNPNKKIEVEEILTGVEITTKALDIPEIQSVSLKEIVLAKARAAFAMVGAPVLVEDVSFEMDCLNGFPGPFVKFWKQVVGMSWRSRSQICKTNMAPRRAAARLIATATRCVMPRVLLKDD